jgi:hypothetical protein
MRWARAIGGAALAVLCACSNDDATSSPTSTRLVTSTAVPCSGVDEAAFEAVVRARIADPFRLGLPQAECADGRWTWAREFTENTSADAQLGVFHASFASAGWTEVREPETYRATWTGDCSPTLRCEAAVTITDTMGGAHTEVSLRSL